MPTNYLLSSAQTESFSILRVPPARKGPLLVIVPSIFGIGPDVTGYAQDFAKAGALVYVLDSFWREDPGPLPIPSESRRAVRRMQAVDPDNVLADILTAVDHGRTDQSCNGSVILLGICFGGRFAWRAASKTPVQALAAWHGGGMLADIKQNTPEAAHLELDFGEADPLIPLSVVDQIRGILHGRENTHIRTHPNSGHGFTHTGTVKYNAQAAKHAKDAVLRLIALHR